MAHLVGIARHITLTRIIEINHIPLDKLMCRIEALGSRGRKKGLP